MLAGFASAFLAGIALAVIAMLAGVERRVAATDARSISIHFGRPLAASFFVGFGATGYALARLSTLGSGMQLLLAAVGGATLAAISLLVVMAWAVPSARRDVPDERFELQGYIGRVVDPIGGDRPGLIVFEKDGESLRLAARSLEAQPIGADAEVVIERVEDGVAWVEPWEQVERRL